MAFIKYEYNIEDEVQLTMNPCSDSCMCLRKNDVNFLDEHKTYKVEDITYFGGGCPSILLHLEGVEETKKSNGNWWEFCVPAVWFKPINQNV